MNTLITGTGCYIPTVRVTNKDFAAHNFFTPGGGNYPYSNDEIAEKFLEITGISERRYVTDNMNSSDIGALAGEAAIKDSGIDRESLDMIIVAQNFGDVRQGTIQTDIVPSIASRIKHHLNIKNPNCVAFDVLYGCPGWIQGMIIADAFIKSGQAKKCLVIGTETLSRVVDPHDRDSMIYSDGAGATVVEAIDVPGRGILATAAESHTVEEVDYLFLGKGYAPDADPRIRYIKMHGRKIYEYALTEVPGAMKACLDKAGVSIDDISKVFIHQANEKMDEAIVKRFFKAYGKRMPETIMPMNIHTLGNSSVATIPTLYDMVLKGNIEGHQVKAGEAVMFASVGAGMNINAIVYRL